MKKKQILIFALILALSVALCGCVSDTPPGETSFLSGENTPPSAVTDLYPEETPGPDYEWISDYSPIPNRRIGLMRRGIISLLNGFECTDTGVYFMCDMGLRGSYLFYGDHGSDTIVKLCGRPDCDHNNEDCSAYFKGGTNICYYAGYLYAVDNSNGGYQLLRMDLDGTNRINVTGTDAIIQGSSGQKYSGGANPTVWNGIFSFETRFLDENGQTVSNTYYYKLDGSMKTPELTDLWLPAQNDGDYFIHYVSAVDNVYGYGVGCSIWDPNNSEGQFLSDVMGLGYYGAEESYYIRDGVVYHLNYAEGQEEVLLETGFNGIELEDLHCFPDHFVVDVRLAGTNPKEASNSTLYFYNWDCEYLGQVELDFPHNESVRHFICGETAERLILTDNIFCVPRYYIEKSDFGTGNIEIREYNMPDVDWGEIGG